MSEVAVTGIGVVSAFGVGTRVFWDGLVAGRSGLRSITRFAASPGALAGQVEGLDVRSVVRTPQGRRIDRTSLLALAACRLALEDAGATASAVPPARTGLALGSAFGNFGETTGFLDRLFARGAGNPLVFPNLVMNAPLSYASIELGTTGPTTFVTDLEVSGESAIAAGAELVADGALDLCLAGGADALDVILWEVLRDADLLPRGLPRPFAADADGACPGEGAAVVVLEPPGQARARGARMYARLVVRPAFGVPASVHGWPCDPEPLAAGLHPVVADADAIVAAASGHAALDRLEAAALGTALGGRRVPVTAPRAATGDFGTAGALAVAAGALAVYTGIVPPTPGVCARPPGFDLVTGEARRGPLRVVVVDGLARGGACRPVRLEAA